MKRFVTAFLIFILAGAAFAPSVCAAPRHFWRIVSPDHEQTFAMGSEKSRAWGDRGPNQHLVLYLDFTNDPYVDRTNPRQYDNFTFSFPTVILGKDGRTFSFRAENGRSIPVARKSPGFLGVEEIKLLPNATLRVDKPHGYLTVTLLVWDHLDPSAASE